MVRVRDVKYAKYGVVEGVMRRVAGSEQPTCIVIAKYWPSWVFGAMGVGLQVRTVLLLNDKWKETLERLLPQVEVVVFNTGGEKESMRIVEMNRVDYVFSDIEPPGRASVWDLAKVGVITSGRRCRRAPSTWLEKRRVLSHSACGGVSEMEVHVHVYLRDGSEVPMEFDVATTGLRDLTAVLDSRARNGVPTPAPKDISLNVLGVVEMPGRAGVYHGGGWLPGGRRDVQVMRDTAMELQPVEERVKEAEVELEEERVKEAAPVEDRTAKATKSDDAEVPEYLWDDRLLLGLSMVKTNKTLAALGVFRKWLICVWRRNVTRSFLKWWLPRRTNGNTDVAPGRLVKYNQETRSYIWAARGRKQYKVMKNQRRTLDRELAKDAHDAIRRSAEATWWEWKEGSFPFFWRWPEWYQDQIRLGVEPWLKGAVPKCAIPQRSEKDPMTFAAIVKKLLVPILKGYLERGDIQSLTSFFSVPKGADDIRMVYDGTKSGLNDAMFAPWFPLPTVDQLLRVVESGSFMGDIDVGEMFLNFVMHKKLRVHCGVDVTAFLPEFKKAEDGTVWFRWSRCGMGFKNSPYVATQGMAVAEEVLMGDRQDEKNIFRWDEVLLNLPGMPDYDPSKAWVAKIRYSDGRIACDVFIYIDDLRTVGPTEEECWKVSRHVASTLNWLGLQDAARKRRPPSQEPGAWAGSIVHSSGEQVELMVSEERWIKAKQMIRWIIEEDQLSKSVDFKILEGYRGFLVYVSRTYPSVCPYLKGIHQTLESWRPWKREDGWNMSVAEVRVAMEESEKSGNDWGFGQGLAKHPVRVKSAPRLSWDLEALSFLFEGNVPTRRKVRPKKTAVAIYGFADASGKGFGSSFVIGDELVFRHGQWSEDIEKESSNFRELSNLVLAIEEAKESGALVDSELFMFTDNTTAEGCYYRGTSQSRKLFELILRLRKIQLDGSLFIHVIHIAGTRMIEEGTDGLSRGSISEGVMTGEDILSYIPLHLAVDAREPEFLPWLLSWCNGGSENKYRVLTPSGWYTTGHTENYCIWLPPPAAADVAVEMLGKSKHKRPTFEHIFACPRLMTNRWRKQLSKVCDVIITIPVGTYFWGVHQHEPLLLAIAFPLIEHRPWRLRGTPLMERVVRELSGLPPHWERNTIN